MPIGTLILFLGLHTPPHWEEVSRSSLVYRQCRSMLQQIQGPARVGLRCLIKVDDN